MIKKIINIVNYKLKKERFSYSNYFINNNDLIVKKIIEETIELFQIFVLYRNNKNCYNRYFLIKEICDLIFHIIVFIIINKITIIEIYKEFIRRLNTDGNEEKQNRYK